MKKVMKVIAAGIVCMCIFCFGKAIRDKTAKVYQQFCEETEPEEWIDFNYWQNRNADVYAWIRIPGTKIDYPVVQGDEDGYYLSHDIDKESNIYGAIYTEKVNGKDFSSPNTVLYGHHMKDGSMFGILKKYKKADFRDTHREIIYQDGQKEGRYKVVALLLADLTTEDYFHYENIPKSILQQNDPQQDDLSQKDMEKYDEDKKTYIRTFLKNAQWKDVDFLKKDYENSILLLSTCEYGTADERLVVLAVSEDK